MNDRERWLRILQACGGQSRSEPRGYRSRQAARMQAALVVRLLDHPDRAHITYGRGCRQRVLARGVFDTATLGGAVTAAPRAVPEPGKAQEPRRSGLVAGPRPSTQEEAA